MKLDFLRNCLKWNTKAEDIMQIFALMSASLATLTFGTLFAWTSPSIPMLLTPEYNITIEQTSYLTIIGPLSMALWSPVYSTLINVIGRKYTLLSCSILHITAWLLIAFAKDKYYLYCISRFVSGMADACCMASAPTYIAEVAKPRVRDIYGNSIMISLFGGQFLVNCVGYYCNIQLTAFILLCIPILFAFTFIFMPESPYYYCMKGQIGKAKTSLQKLYRKEDVIRELAQLSADVKRQMSERGTLKDLWIIKSNRKGFLIVNLLRSVQQLSGITALLAYSQYIFQQSGGDISSGVAAMIFSGLLAVTSLFGNIIADKLGKTMAVVTSCLGSGCSLLGVTVYFYYEIYTDVDVSVVSYIPIVGLVLFVTFFSFGLSTIPTTIIGEIFSASIRSQAVMFTSIVFALYMAGTSKLFQFLMSTFGLCVPFLLFTICCFLGAIASYFFVPNTQGKTLEEIQQLLKGNR